MMSARPCGDSFAPWGRRNRKRTTGACGGCVRFPLLAAGARLEWRLLARGGGCKRREGASREDDGAQQDDQQHEPDRDDRADEDLWRDVRRARRGAGEALVEAGEDLAVAGRTPRDGRAGAREGLVRLLDPDDAPDLAGDAGD